MKKSDKNLSVIENFILHLTHSSDKGDSNFDKLQSYTPRELYKIAQEYIDEDHVDGKGNPEDHIVTFGAESSFVTNDREKAFEEHIVVVADFGDKMGTMDIATIYGMENLNEVNHLFKVIATYK